ncbi:putative inorganic phosphate cotransporter [Eupeodes corollae]|uniref:putative inorganic phosphate cotransporter n=1 Tax=Eupeodes corollae TaxID=290404 RepID=UPI0024912BBA|nr:putative inorganic phosphate cotransporter [Eupeodes corollae]
MAEIEKTPAPPRLSFRNVQFFLVFLCYALNFMSRLNCSFALVAMTNAESANLDFDEYNWNEQQISYIISAANFGVVLTMIPGSLISRKIGIKATIAASVLGSSILSLVTPASIPLGGWQIYCVIRLLQGMFQGLFFPCSVQHLANWAPPSEVTRFGALSYNGAAVGIVLAMGSSGFIAKSSWGWPGISYFAGVLGIIWNVIWHFLGNNSPASSKYISPEERDFILESQQKNNGAQRKIPIPWKAIFTSPPFLSLVIVNLSTYWGYITILLEIPLYMQGVLNMDIKSNSIFSSIPFVAVVFMAFVYLYLLKILSKSYSINFSKKIINTIATWIPAAALFWVGFLDENQKELAISLMVIIVGVNAGITVGSGMNTNELSPNHAGVLAAVANTGRAIVSVIAPLFAGIVVNNNNNRFQWQIVFMVAGIVFFVGNLQYLIFGTTSKQSWDNENFLKPYPDIESDIKPEANQREDKSELNELIEKPILLSK